MARSQNSYRRVLDFLVNPRFITLTIVVLAVVGLIAFLGKPLLPFFVALVLAYFLNGGVNRLLRWKDNRRLAFGLVFGAFLLLYVVGIAGPLQLIVRQGFQLARNLPAIVEKLKALVFEYRTVLEGYWPAGQHERLTGMVGEQLGDAGENILSAALTGIPHVTTWGFYLFLIPLIVFFLLKDKELFLKSITRLLPRDRELVERIWVEVEEKIANYVRGKVWEILIVGTVTTAVFFVLGFQYSAILGLFSGISVLIPFVGAIGVAIPVFVLGFVQWGMGPDLAWLIGAYVVIQVLDGNVLAPVIFSEAVQLHPVYILLGVVVFGSLFGFWGVFFAIPLATLAKATINALLEMYDQPA